MTAQRQDTFIYKKEDYDLVAMSKPLSFKPEDYGIIPEGLDTACWAGFWCEYSISEEGIFLKNFYVNSKDGNYPEINGVTPVKKKLEILYGRYQLYKDVNLKIPYTGRILIGKDFLREYYIHMGYQRAWAYKVLKELIFQEGILVEEISHSRKAKELREQIDANPEFMKKLADNVLEFVDSSFDLSMETKAWWIK